MEVPDKAGFGVEIASVLRGLRHPATAKKQCQSACGPFPYRANEKSCIERRPAEAPVTYPGPLPNGVLPAKFSFAISGAYIDRNRAKDGIRQIERQLMPQDALLSPAPEKTAGKSAVREAVVAGGLRAEIGPPLQEDANTLYLDSGEGAE